MPEGVEHLDVIPLPVLLAAMIALLLLAIESGNRLGRWRRQRAIWPQHGRLKHG
jgi:hypothetical protein